MATYTAKSPWRLPDVEGRWVTELKQVRVNQVDDSEAPASISTKISFSIPRMESANLRGGQKEDVNILKGWVKEKTQALNEHG